MDPLSNFCEFYREGKLVCTEEVNTGQHTVYRHEVYGGWPTWWPRIARYEARLFCRTSRLTIEYFYQYHFKEWL